MITCPSCLTEQKPAHILTRQGHHGTDLFFYFCRTCDLVFHVDPIPADYYEAQYRAEANGSTEVIPEVATEQHIRAGALMPFIAPLVQATGITRALDVGCSSGALLARVQEELGMQVAGVEPGLSYSEYARARNITVYSSIENTPGEFDLITCIHVLEHQQQPRPFLERMAQMGKYLLLEIPYLMTNRGACSYPHPLAFNENALYNLLSYTGWMPIWILPYWGIHPRYKKPHYLLALAQTGPADRYFYMTNSLGIGLSSYNSTWRDGAHEAK